MTIWTTWTFSVPSNMEYFMILWSCGCYRCTQMCGYVTIIDTNPLNLPMRACVVPKSWQCWWEGPLWFSHPASHWNQVGPSGCVPCYSHKIKLLKATQVNLYGHNHTCAVGTGTSATLLLTPVQPGGWTRVCCISFLGWVSLQGKPVWVGWVVSTKAVITQRNTGVCRGTRTSVHMMRNYSAPHSSSSSIQRRIGAFPGIVHHCPSSPGLVHHLWGTNTSQTQSSALS